jgi:hypothetical protein
MMHDTTVTRLLERGMSFAVVAAIMGWSAATSVRMAKRYGHISDSPQRGPMGLLGSVDTVSERQSLGGGQGV